jgi:hypothetical protein
MTENIQFFGNVSCAVKFKGHLPKYFRGPDFRIIFDEIIPMNNAG